MKFIIVFVSTLFVLCLMTDRVESAAFRNAIMRNYQRVAKSDAPLKKAVDWQYRNGRDLVRDGEEMDGNGDENWIMAKSKENNQKQE